MTRKPKVLVIGDDTRSFLASVRSLGRQGIEVHAAPYALGSPGLQSKYISKVYLLPFYLDGGAEWLKAMQEIMQKEVYDMILPCEERSLLPLFVHQNEFPAGTVLAIPDATGLEAFFDKVNTRELAHKTGVPVARSYVCQPSDGQVVGSATITADSLGDFAANITASLTFPIIVKHKKSYSLPDLYIRTKVEILPTPEKLQQWLARNQSQLADVYFEEIFAGIGLGVSVLAHQGKVLQAFEHHRVNELSGSSYYRKSMPLDAARLEAVSKMVAETRYTGLGMFEFKLNSETGAWILLEVNARPWGSMPLPVALGVDFPYRLYQLLCKNEQGVAINYRTHVYGRNFISDIWQVKAVASEMRSERLNFLSYFIKWCASFGRILINRERHDVFVFDDPLPGWLEIKQFVLQRIQAFQKPAALRFNQHLSSLLRQPAGQASAPHVLFLCQGNICRSSYAEIKARQLFEQAGLSVTVGSAGMLPRNRRASPSTAIAAAGQSGIDLSVHRSQHAFAEIIQSASCIIIFDRINERYFLERYPEAADRLVYLSQFSDQSLYEIDDPDRCDIDVFLHVYRQIDQCLAGLIRQFKI